MYNNIMSNKKIRYKMGSQNTNIESPIFEEDNNSKPQPNYNIQIQGKVEKQLVKQKISQEYTADIFGKALSSSEHYSSRFGKKPIKNMQFNYYNLFDSGINKNKEELKKSIIAFLDILQDYYLIDGKCFPSGIDINQVKNYLMQLKENFDNLEDRNIYDLFISIIDGKRIDLSGFFNTKNAAIDPKVLTTKGIQVLKSTGRQEKQWEEKVLKNGNYDVGFNLGKNWTDNKNYSNMHSNMEQNSDEDFT